VELGAYTPTRQQPQPSLSTRGAFASVYSMANHRTPSLTVSRNPYPPIVLFKVEAAARH